MTANRAIAPTSGQEARHEVLVDLELCKACGICVSAVPQAGLRRRRRASRSCARVGDCTACRLCEWHCPDFAIEVLRRRGGTRTKAGGEADAAGPADEHAERVAEALLRAKQRDHRHVPSDGGHHEEQ